MNDLISRQAAIEAIDEYDFEFPNYMERFVTELRDAMKADIKNDIEALPPAQPEQQWIPCSKRPPEEEGEYLITVKYKPVDGYEDVYTEHGEWVAGAWKPSCEHCGEVESILAWKPLPKPYREGKG